MGIRASRLGMLLLYGCSFDPNPAGVDPTHPAIDAARLVDAAVTDGPPPPPDDAGFVTTNHPSVADTFLSTFMQTTNFNSETSMLSDADGRVAVIRFDLSAVPAGAAISAAQLHIWTDSDPGGLCTFFPLLEAWDETTTTWILRATGVGWMVAGASPPSRSIIAAGSVIANQANTENTVTIDPAVIAAWVANPSTNFGFAIVTLDVDGARFTTREGASGRQPQLRIKHQP